MRRQRHVVGRQHVSHISGHVEPGQHGGDLIAVQVDGRLARPCHCERRFQQVGRPEGAYLAQLAADGDRGVGSCRLHQSQRHRGGLDRPRAAACQRVAGRLERAQLHRVGRLDVQQRADRRQLALWPSRRHRKQRVGELRAARRDAGAPPIAAAADKRVVEVVGPVLELEIRAIRGGASRLVDPDPGGPAGARPHQRGVQGALGVDGEAGHPTVEQRDRAILERLHLRRGPLVHDDLGVGQVVGQRRHRGAQVLLVSAVDHQHRQRARCPQVRAGQPGPRQRVRGRHPHPGRAGLRQLPLQFGGVGRGGLGQHGLGERVAVRPTERDPGVRQIGIDIEVAVARLVGAAAGRGDARADQRDHQVARHRAGHRLRRRHHLGHRHRAHPIAGAYPHRRGQPEPAVGRVVQGPRMLGGVHRFGPLVQQRETPPDDGVPHFADRHGAGYRTRPAQPQQAVFPGELVDAGAAVHPVDAVPQGECLRVAQQGADPPPHDQPLTERAAVCLHLRRACRGAHHRPRGQ
ncbi:Uncharacterised protein [Mycobacterium tuberculosis]|nr:Uncharacterised protein [Mycobacterium tuberculosis]CKT50285.1 Uncharacterised protein [Mycobacterium tuberculosis]